VIANGTPSRTKPGKALQNTKPDDVLAAATGCATDGGGFAAHSPRHDRKNPTPQSATLGKRATNVRGFLQRFACVLGHFEKLTYCRPD
jgi:hypothetical protein